MSSALECDGLSKRYRRKWALRDCTLSIPAGCVAGLVGPNGAGKTTLLHLAVGLLTPDEGSIRVSGYDPLKQPKQLLKEVGFVSQEHPLYKTFRVNDMIRFGCEMNTCWDKDFVIKRLEQLNIPLDRPTGKLSGGQQAQVALLMALAKHPKLLILDEPVASLDPLARREFQQILMDKVAQDNVTVILSSHLVTDLERFCDYLVILAPSRVQIATEIKQLLQSHKLLVGPGELANSIVNTHRVLQISHNEQQSEILVQDYRATVDPIWNVQDLSLEDIALAYLAQPQTSALIYEKKKQEVL